MYLRQHGEDPVDWYPWGDEAFAAAAARDVPLLISIGYSSCHWCHVMAHESFADPTVAALINAHYVAIKVDREEHPDIDAQYMTAVQLISGHGGWPMTIFALPDGRPFFAGTYFPKKPRYGQPGFMALLQRIAELWVNERDKLTLDADTLAAAVRRRALAPPPVDVAADAIADVVAATLEDVDLQVGGHYGAPKFPPHQDLRLWQWALQGGAAKSATLHHAWRKTLDAMACGGLRDQLGGAFHRYTVDAHWRIPHFEQMLYDNAQLLLAYADAAALSNDGVDREVTAALVDELNTRWRAPGGWLAAAWDADDPGGEGAYYTWTPDEIAAALADPDDTAWACAYFQVDAHGQVEGRSTLAARTPARGEDAATIVGRLRRIRPALLAARAARPAPARDDKGVAAWNGLALLGLAQAARVLGPRVIATFADVAAAIRTRALETEPARAWYPTGGVGRATLEDLAALALGLWRFGLEADDPEHVSAAVELVERLLARFLHVDGWTASVEDALLGTPPGWWDGQTPSPYALTLDLLSELAPLKGDDTWEVAADRLLQHVSGAMAQAPRATRGLWRALARRDQGMLSIVAVGNAAGPWLDGVRPRLVSDVILMGPRVAAWAAAEDWAVMAGRTTPEPSAYVCHGRTCRLPATSAEALAAQVAAAVLQ